MQEQNAQSYETGKKYLLPARRIRPVYGAEDDRYINHARIKYVLSSI